MEEGSDKDTGIQMGRQHMGGRDCALLQREEAYAEREGDVVVYVGEETQLDGVQGKSDSRDWAVAKDASLGLKLKI